MTLTTPSLPTPRSSGRCFMRLNLVGSLVLGALLAPAPALAQSKDEETGPELPRLGLDPAEPSVRSAQPATPFGVSPATSKEYVLDFHGYLLLPLRVGVHEREDESGTA